MKLWLCWCFSTNRTHALDLYLVFYVKKGEVLLPQILQVHDLQTCTLNKTLPITTIQPSFKQLNQQRTWSPSGYQDQMMYSRMTELIQEEQWDVEGVWMINPIKSDYEHLLPSPWLPKMADPGMPTIHRSINQRCFQRSCPQHGNRHYSMSKMADQDH
jgi:hypothetical protein